MLQVHKGKALRCTGNHLLNNHLGSHKLRCSIKQDRDGHLLPITKAQIKEKEDAFDVKYFTDMFVSRLFRLKCAMLNFAVTQDYLKAVCLFVCVRSVCMCQCGCLVPARNSYGWLLEKCSHLSKIARLTKLIKYQKVLECLFKGGKFVVKVAFLMLCL